MIDQIDNKDGFAAFVVLVFVEALPSLALVSTTAYSTNVELSRLCDLKWTLKV